MRQNPASRARRRLAAMLLPIATALLIAGILPLVLRTDVALKIVGAIVVAFSSMLLLVVSGLRRVARNQEDLVHEAQLDAAILAASPGCGGACDSCGVDDCAVKALPRT